MQTVLKPAIGESSSPSSPADVREAVAAIIADVRARGDAAVREYAERFDRWSPERFRLDDEQIARIVAGVPAQVLDDIRTAQANLRAFAQAQRESLRDFEVETVPAATVAAMHLAGADELYLLGGVQAMAALAIGTETIERVDILAGPGNAYVAEAKRQLFGEVGIDLFAGPTEILVVADESADPFIVAVDLLSQAEHGPDSPAVLITTSEALGREVIRHVDRLLPGMPTRDDAEPAWRDHGQVIVVADLATGGPWVGKFLKTVTYQEITSIASSVALGELCGRASRVEELEGHARAGDVRVAKYAGGQLDWAPRAVAEASA